MVGTSRCLFVRAFHSLRLFDEWCTVVRQTLRHVTFSLNLNWSRKHSHTCHIVCPPVLVVSHYDAICHNVLWCKLSIPIHFLPKKGMLGISFYQSSSQWSCGFVATVQLGMERDVEPVESADMRTHCPAGQGVHWSTGASACVAVWLPVLKLSWHYIYSNKICVIKYPAQNKNWSGSTLTASCTMGANGSSLITQLYKSRALTFPPLFEPFPF